jgi:hypothetical protein
MPRKAIDYSKSCVYRLIYDNTTRYVGSTTNFTNRKNAHKTNSNSKNINSKSYNSQLYRFIRETGGWGDNKKWDMVLIEQYPNCKSAKELRKYERHHYDLLLPDLNTNRPITTTMERSNDKRESGIKYRADNADTISEYQKQYQTDNKEKLKDYINQYRIDNKVSILDKRRQYLIDNKDAINAKMRQKRLDKKKSST